MPYRVRVSSRVQNQMLSWNLRPAALVNVRLRLESLSDRPADRLLPAAPPYRGMRLIFHLIDPENRLAEYHLTFNVLYGQDEETLHVINGACGSVFG